MNTERVKRRGFGSSVGRKLKSRGGFTLTELLMCTVIMLLATGLIVQTLDLAFRQFQSQNRSSEAELLANTLALVMQNQISHANRYAYNVQEDTLDFTGNLTTESVKYRVVSENGILVMDFFEAGGKIPFVEESIYGSASDRFRAAATITEYRDKVILINLDIRYAGTLITSARFTVHLL